MEKQICTKCKTEKDLGEFYLYGSERIKRYTQCKSCYRSRASSYQRIKYYEYKDQIIEMLGGCCVECGYNENILGLEIDHINNNGCEDRGNRKGPSATDFKKWIINNCVGLQLLCGTCHSIKTRLKMISMRPW